MALEIDPDNSLAPLPTAPDLRTSRAGRRLRGGLKALLLLIALCLVLLPRNRLSPLVYPILFGVPLVYAASRRESERAFMLWSMYVISFAGFVAIRRIADDTGVPWLHSYVIGVDRVLGLGEVPSAVLQRLWYVPSLPGIVDTMAIGFHLSYYVVPPAVAILLWGIQRAAFERYLVAISITYLLGAGLHLALPTVPPWMASQAGYIHPVARVLYDRVHQAAPEFYSVGNALAGGNAVAAMPSLHMATAWLIFVAAREVGRPAAWAALLYAFGMGFALVYMGEHYVTDLLGGMVVASASWLWAPALLRRLFGTAVPGSTSVVGT
jgi:membrane-associated phospholipid phosphatase